MMQVPPQPSHANGPRSSAAVQQPPAISAGARVGPGIGAGPGLAFPPGMGVSLVPSTPVLPIPFPSLPYSMLPPGAALQAAHPAHLDPLKVRTGSVPQATRAHTTQE